MSERMSTRVGPDETNRCLSLSVLARKERAANAFQCPFVSIVRFGPKMSIHRKIDGIHEEGEGLFGGSVGSVVRADRLIG